MTEYRVTWEIDIEADSPREAAEKALAIQHQTDSIATVFLVKGGSLADGNAYHGQIDLTPEHAVAPEDHLLRGKFS